MRVTSRPSATKLLNADGVTIRELQYLVALADSAHFGRAAAACRVTQPTLSMQLKKLEGRVGGPLVRRTGSGAVLTPLGVDTVSRARRVLQEVVQIHDLGLARNGAPERPVRVGLDASLAPFVAPRLLAQVSRREVVLHEAPARVLMDDLTACDIDLLLSAGRGAGQTRVDERALAPERLLLALPVAHAQTQHQVITASQLHGLPLIIPTDVPSPEDLGLWAGVADSHTRTGLNWPGSGCSTASALRLVQAGQWCCLLTGLAAQGAQLPAGVVLRPVSLPGRTLSVWVRCLHDSPLRGALQALVPVLRAACTPAQDVAIPRDNAGRDGHKPPLRR